MEYLEVLKVALIYFLMIIILRILGKREVGQLSIFDLVIILLLANIASLGLDNPSFFLLSIISLLVLMLLQKLISFVLLHKASLRDFVEGKPRVLIYKGKILYKNMKKESYTFDDLTNQTREQGYSSFGNIYLLILEPNGKISIFTDKVELQIISCGRFNKDNLELLNLNKKYVIEFLNQNKIDYKKILAGSILDNKLIYFYKGNKKEVNIKERTITLI